MSRSGYVDDLDNWALIRWRGAVASAIRGRSGQRFLRELRDALDAMPEKKLIREELEQDGNVCALGSLGRARGLDMSAIDPDDRDGVAKLFGISLALTCEIMAENDDSWRHDTPSQRWQRMRSWVEDQIK